MKKIPLFFLTLCLPFGCCRNAYLPNGDSTTLFSLNIVDSNGFTETIHSKDRLSSYQNVDFLSPQPYEKVVRIFTRNLEGTVRSLLTSYHPNGQVWQYLEVLNGKANGKYREWFPNGKAKLEAQVVGGRGELAAGAQESWQFDGVSKAWDEEGHLLAAIPYQKGALSGESLYYYPEGSLWKRIPFENNLTQGMAEVFYRGGEVQQQIPYVNGKAEGTALWLWQEGQIAAKEEYEQGWLKTGEYFDHAGKPLSSVKNGNGFKALFDEKELIQLQEYRNGLLEGKVNTLSKGRLLSTYFVKNNVKHGEEILYYAPEGFATPTEQPKLLITWKEGIIQGAAKTWYENGHLESQREMSGNKKCGLSTAWYRDGTLMFVEEYQNNILVNGEYYKKGESRVVSRVLQGSGEANLFDSDGVFLQKIAYKEGKPQNDKTR